MLFAVCQESGVTGEFWGAYLEASQSHQSYCCVLTVH